MHRIRAVSLAAICAGLLCACSKPSAGGASNAAPNTASAPAGDVVINESQLPHPRAGQWELVDNASGGGARDRFCVVDRPFNVGRMRTYCQKFVFRRTLTGGISVDSECGQHGVTSKMHMTAQGDFQSAYSTDMQLEISLKPGQPPRTSTTHLEYRYVGACTPDEQAATNAAAKGE